MIVYSENQRATFSRIYPVLTGDSPSAITLEPKKLTFAFKRLAYESCVTYGIKHACENNNIGRNTLRGDFYICARKKCISFCSIFEVEGHHE